MIAAAADEDMMLGLDDGFAVDGRAVFGAGFDTAGDDGIVLDSGFEGGGSGAEALFVIAESGAQEEPVDMGEEIFVKACPYNSKWSEEPNVAVTTRENG